MSHLPSNIASNFAKPHRLYSTDPSQPPRKFSNKTHNVSPGTLDGLTDLDRGAKEVDQRESMEAVDTVPESPRVQQASALGPYRRDYLPTLAKCAH